MKLVIIPFILNDVRHCIKKSNISPSKRHESIKRLMCFKRKLCKFIMHLGYRWLLKLESVFCPWSQSSHVTHKIWKINLQKVCVITLQGQWLKHKALCTPVAWNFLYCTLECFCPVALVKKNNQSSQLCFWWINDDIVGFRGHYTTLSCVESQLLNH